MSTTLIQGGTIIDGRGGAGYEADLLIADDKIAAVGRMSLEASAADRIVSARGKVVCPGFVDIHRHCDAKLLQPDAAETLAPQLLSQGITSVAVGNCGMSLTPSPKDPGAMYDHMEAVLGTGCRELHLSDYRAYKDALVSASLPVNVASMVGTGSVRITVKGFSDTPLSAKELAEASALIEDALAAGAVGISTGIMYIPECYGTVKEFAAMLRPLGRYGRPLTAHIRGEGDHLAESVREILAIGREAGCPVEISHFKCCGMNNWGKGIHKAIGLIEEARAGGQDVTCDFYPYEGGSTALTTMLPPAFVRGDLSTALARLGTPGGVDEFRSALALSYPDWDNYAITLGWDRILISGVSCEENRCFIGHTVEEAAGEFGFADAAACAAYLMYSDQGKTSIINRSMCREDIDTVARLPYSIVISDSIYADTDTPHPRMYGSFPKILREYVRERHVLSLEEAIAKMTSMPARRMGLKGRGVLAPGAYADILVFDPSQFQDHAVYSAPRRLASGLEYAWVNGRSAWENGAVMHRDAGAGLFLPHPQ